MADRWLVVGLGNFGPSYEKTRHNIGHLVVEHLAQDQKFSSHKSQMKICEIKEAESSILLAKSLGYMNESGGPTKALADFYKVSVTQIIAIHDELDLPFAHLRIKSGGGDNGHNGLKSLSASFSTADYYRIRMGIGRPMEGVDPADFVLKNFSKDERKVLSEFIERGAQAVNTLITQGLDKAQTGFNS